MKNKKYKSINEVSKLLDINTHVIRYWDSKFDGISTRINNNHRFFNPENIKKLKELKNIMYQNGKNNYQLELAKKLLNKKININHDKDGNQSALPVNNSIIGTHINKLKNISEDLKKLLTI